MSLITMGLGHLTLLTMGLGVSVRGSTQRFIFYKQYGDVQFEKIDTTVEFAEEPVEIAFDKSKGEDVAFDKGGGIEYG